jgi:hypothetical protein
LFCLPFRCYAALLALQVAAAGPGRLFLPPSSSATTYTITYSDNGATGARFLSMAISTRPEPGSTCWGNTGNSVNIGYTFSGWNTAANGSGTAYTAGATFAMGSDDMVLYA